MFQLYILWKQQKISGFHVFRGYKMGTLATNELSTFVEILLLRKSQKIIYFVFIFSLMTTLDTTLDTHL